MGRVDGKVVLITGAARGQGRSHALRLAQEGASIIAVDACRPIATVGSSYDLPTPADLQETVRLVEAADGRIHAAEVDVRDADGLRKAVEEGVAELGRLDGVVANAAIFTFDPVLDYDQAAWSEQLDINVTGVWNTVRAALPSLIASGPGGSITLIGSMAAAKGVQNLVGYTTAKHALVGLMKTLVNELGPHGIRINMINPNAIKTPMTAENRRLFTLFRPDLPAPTVEDLAAPMQGLNPMGVGMLDAIHVSHAVLFLVSDEATYVSGGQIPVDAGAAVQ